jgi:hypothetical protein
VSEKSLSTVASSGKMNNHNQACKFICLMCDISTSAYLSCLSVPFGTEKMIVSVSRLLVDRISSETRLSMRSRW